MGSRQSLEQWVDQIPVPATKPTYPAPEPPRFLLPDLLKNYKIRDGPDNTEGKINWNKVKQIATTPLDQQAAIETGRISQGQSFVNEKTVVSKRDVNGDVTKQDTQVGPVTNDKDGDETNKQKGKDENVADSNTSNKIAFDEIDQHAREATLQHAESFKALFDYIKEKIPPTTKYPGVYLVRGITAWFCNQQIESLKPVTASLAHPAGLVQHVRNKSLTLTSAYALLLRAANIPCVIIQGLEKRGHYRPGDPVNDITEGTWCGVHVDRSWQIVHPLWACRGTYSGAKEKENRILIEEDAQMDSDFTDLIASLQKPKTQQNKKELAVKHAIVDDYFMPKPEIFKYRCNSFDRKWNLLSKQSEINPRDELKHLESTLSSSEHFRMQAHLSPAFFKTNLQLMSSNMCTLMSEGGIVKIEFEVTKELTRKLLFRHKLSVKEVDNAMDERLKPENISRLVLYYRCNDRAVFEISLPRSGTYMFEITGGMKGKFYNLAAFQLMSTEDYDVSLLPLETGVDGWGPGPKSQLAGLLVPSKPKGVISYQTVTDDKTKEIHRRNISIEFQVSREIVENVEFTAELVNSVSHPPNQQTQGNIKEKMKPPLKQSTNQPSKKSNKTIRFNEASVRSQDMKDWVSCTKDRLTKTLTIDITLMKDGIYGLIIRSTEIEDKPLNMKAFKQGTTRDVCYYLLKPYYQTKQGPKLKFAKTELLRAMNGENHGDMKTAVDRCLMLGLDVTNEDIAACQVKMEYLKHKTDIIECIKRRNLSVLNDTLLRVVKYRYRAALVDDVRELLDFRKRILAIDGYQMYLPTIREAIDELYKMPHVPPEVHNTVAAALVVLKHPVEELDWAYIKNQLRTTGNNSGHLARQIERYETLGVPPDIADIQIAEQVLYRCSFPQVLHVNHSAATFYKWVEALTIRLREYDRAQREYAEQMASRQAEIERRTAEKRRLRQAKKEKHKHMAF